MLTWSSENAPISEKIATVTWQAKRREHNSSAKPVVRF